jgi:hypothetical protein
VKAVHRRDDLQVHALIIERAQCIAGQLHRSAGLQLESAQLVGDQRRMRPELDPMFAALS